MEAIYDMGIPHPITPYPRLIINACITGMVPMKKDTPHVPLSVDEIIEDAARCYDAGASMVHVHARDEDGQPTYKKEVYGDIISGIRARRPDMIICASTSGRIHNTFECRSEVLELTGDAKPDMGSLTMGSLNFPKQASINEPEMINSLATAMRDRGIVPEIECFETGMIQTTKVLIQRGVLVKPFYCNLLFGSIFSAPATLFDLSHMVKSLPPGMPWGAAGIGKFQLKMNFAAVLSGGNVRVGLEDNIWFDQDAKELATNAGLVERVANFSRQIGREVATAKQAREIIGLA